MIPGFEEMLNNSRTVQQMEAIERGEDVDLDELARLQDLDVVRVGELFVLDTLKREDAEDEQFERTLNGGTGGQ